MEMKHRTSQILTQRLTITPRMQQALKLLQLNNLVLEQVVREEMAANPTLEEEDGLTEAPDPEVMQAGQESADRIGGAETGPDTTPAETVEAERGETEPTDAAPEKNEIDWDDYFHDDYESPNAGTEERSTDAYERVPVSRQSLDEYVAEQLRYKDLNDDEIRVGEYIIGSIDNRGYLTMSAPEIAAELQVEVAVVERVIALVQSLDPPGIGARDLRECLLLQLKARGCQEHLAYRVVDEHFDDLTRRRQVEIARALKVPVEEIQRCIDLISTLSPVPGAQISAPDAEYVYPDLVVERVDDQYVVYLNDKNVPRLRISTAYEHVLQSNGQGGGRPAGRRMEAPANGTGTPAAAISQDAEARRYVTEKLSSARWLIQTIEQRRRTMVKVMKAIVEEQRDFFEKGEMYLHPLTLQNVASKIGMHESTVSRVTSGKYCQTPRGVFELKYFFSSGLSSDGGEDVSAKSAKAMIAKLIDQEDKKDPLSDQRIAEILKEQGLDIARRTVAKYREQLNVPNARYRKRH